MIEHAGRYKNSHAVKHCVESNHKLVTLENVKVLKKNVRNAYKRKISEVLYIKNNKLSLNVQEKSILLKLFN